VAVAVVVAVMFLAPPTRAVLAVVVLVELVMEQQLLGQ